MDQGKFETKLLAFVQSEESYQELGKGMASDTFDLQFGNQRGFVSFVVDVKKALESIFPYHKIFKSTHYDLSDIYEDYSVIVDKERIVVSTCWNTDCTTYIDMTLLKSKDLDQTEWMIVS